jgi:hypothetical protein
MNFSHKGVKQHRIKTMLFHQKWGLLSDIPSEQESYTVERKLYRDVACNVPTF